MARLQDQLGTTMVYVTHDQTEAMTLGDRVAIMRAGLLQQVGTPMELYNEPNNLFVAGFIGSPSMNFLPATVEGDTIKLPMVDVKLPQARREQLGRMEAGKQLIAGIRPEDFEDAGVVGTAATARRSRPRIDVLEAMGSSSTPTSRSTRRRTSSQRRTSCASCRRTRAARPPAGGFDVVARLDQTSTAKAKSESEIWINTEKIQLFDPDAARTYGRLRTRAAGRPGPSAAYAGRREGPDRRHRRPRRSRRSPCWSSCGGATGGAVAFALFGVASVLGVSLVFLAVGRSEDAERPRPPAA